MINSKQKGSRIEREVVDFLKSSGFPNARRSQQYNGADGESDVVGEGLEKFHIECKGLKNCLLQKATLKKWYLQIERDNKKDRFPVIFFKGNNCDLVLLVPLNKLTVPVKEKFWAGVILEESFNPSKFFFEHRKSMRLFDLWRGAFPDPAPKLYLNIKDNAYLYEIEEDKHFVFLEAKQFLMVNEVLSSEKS